MRIHYYNLAAIAKKKSVCSAVCIFDLSHRFYVILILTSSTSKIAGEKKTPPKDKQIDVRKEQKRIWMDGKRWKLLEIFINTYDRSSVRHSVPGSLAMMLAIRRALLINACSPK